MLQWALTQYLQFMSWLLICAILHVICTVDGTYLKKLRHSLCHVYWEIAREIALIWSDAMSFMTLCYNNESALWTHFYTVKCILFQRKKCPIGRARK